MSQRYPTPVGRDFYIGVLWAIVFGISFWAIVLLLVYKIFH